MKTNAPAPHNCENNDNRCRFEDQYGRTLCAYVEAEKTPGADWIVSDVGTSSHGGFYISGMNWAGLQPESFFWSVDPRFGGWTRYCFKNAKFSDAALIRAKTAYPDLDWPGRGKSWDL